MIIFILPPPKKNHNTMNCAIQNDAKIICFQGTWFLPAPYFFALPYFLLVVGKVK